MIYTILFIIGAIFYAKPVYWAGKYLYFLISKPEDNSYSAYYGDRVANWLINTWNYVKWNKDDL